MILARKCSAPFQSVPLSTPLPSSHSVIPSEPSSATATPKSSLSRFINLLIISRLHNTNFRRLLFKLHFGILECEPVRSLPLFPTSLHRLGKSGSRPLPRVSGRPCAKQ